ncbi:hypothetical protein [Roseovarius sp.]|uniref:hypothetical protein n=1 Tax=Roseovarius sp. TaxID=1486281 RepID=UPI003A96AFDC
MQTTRLHTIRRGIAPVLALLAFGTLAACGDTIPEQALLGGGAGALTGAVVGGSVVTGAAVGAAGNVVYCQAYPGRC